MIIKLYIIFIMYGLFMFHVKNTLSRFWGVSLSGVLLVSQAVSTWRISSYDSIIHFEQPNKQLVYVNIFKHIHNCMR